MTALIAETIDSDASRGAWWYVLLIATAAIGSAAVLGLVKRRRDRGLVIAGTLAGLTAADIFWPFKRTRQAATTAIGGGAATVVVLLIVHSATAPASDLGGRWAVRDSTIVRPVNFTDNVWGGGTWLFHRTSCDQRGRCDYRVTPNNGPAFTVTATSPSTWEGIRDHIADCVDTERPDRVIVKNGYRDKITVIASLADGNALQIAETVHGRPTADAKDRGCDPTSGLVYTQGKRLQG